MSNTGYYKTATPCHGRYHGRDDNPSKNPRDGHSKPSSQPHLTPTYAGSAGYYYGGSSGQVSHSTFNRPPAQPGYPAYHSSTGGSGTGQPKQKSTVTKFLDAGKELMGKVVEMKKDGNGVLHVVGKGRLANIRGSLDLKTDKKLQGSMSGKRGENLPPSYEEAMGGYF